MHQLKKLALGLAFCALCVPVYAEEANIGTETVPKYDFTYEMGQNMPVDVFLGEITTEEMYKQLREELDSAKVYLKMDDKALVFQALSKDKASCKQILFAAPAEQFIEVYTNDKKSYNKFWSAIKPYTSEWRLVDGYQVACDKNQGLVLGENKNLFRIWFKKVKPDNRTYRVQGGYVPDYYPYYWPVSIGVVWGHHHHYSGRVVAPPPHHGPRPGHRPPPRPRK